MQFLLLVPVNLMEELKENYCFLKPFLNKKDATQNMPYTCMGYPTHMQKYMH